MKHFYELSAKNIQGKEISMKDFEGKVIVVVNTASKCGLTPQYEWLEKLYEKYKQDGLVILGFPCNQFANQESWDEKSIQEWCLLNYGVTFPMFSKVEVNGENAHEIFSYLKKELPWFLTSDIKWNFTKFVLDTKWKPVKRYAPTTKPENMEKTLLKYLQK